MSFSIHTSLSFCHPRACSCFSSDWRKIAPTMKTPCWTHRSISLTSSLSLQLPHAAVAVRLVLGFLTHFLPTLHTAVCSLALYTHTHTNTPHTLILSFFLSLSLFYLSFTFTLPPLDYLLNQITINGCFLAKE